MWGREAFKARVEQLERELHVARETAEQWRACYYEQVHRADRMTSEALELAKRTTPIRYTGQAVEAVSTVETSAPEAETEDDAAEEQFTPEIQRAIAFRGRDEVMARELTFYAGQMLMRGMSPDDIAATIEHGLMVEPDDDGSYEDYA